jgi:ABC-type methionine transport system ATPase subunit
MAKKETRRLWLIYPQKRIKEPIIYLLGHKFKVVTNVRQCSVTDQVGLVSIELDGERSEIKKAIKWLESKDIKVEPVEINVIEG